MIKHTIRAAAASLVLASGFAATSTQPASAASTVWCFANPAPGTCNANSGDTLNLLLANFTPAQVAEYGSSCAYSVYDPRGWSYAIDCDF